MEVIKFIKSGVDKISLKTQPLNPFLTFLTPFMVIVTLSLFIPQIILLHEIKKSDQVSLITLGGSWLLQMHGVLLNLNGKQYRQLAIVSCSIVLLSVVIGMVICYR